MYSLETLPPLRDVLTAHGLFAKKNLGQHFLLDLNLTDKIARLTRADTAVIEVGPGPGGLTRSLLIQNQDRPLTVIEKDDRFLPILSDIQSLAPVRMNIVSGDALNVEYSDFAEHPIQICANLPYNVGTKLVTNWLSAQPPYWNRLVLMLQKEVAERLAARPGDKAYGRLAVLCASVAQSRIAFEVPASAFTPPPKVDSAVIVIDPLPDDERFEDLATLGRLTLAAFGQRRKMLRKSLKPFAAANNVNLDDWLDDAGIDGSTRPETLAPQDFHQLVRTLTPAHPSTD